MKTPHDKYQGDPAYRNLVDMIEGFITAAEFTPSELREAVVLAHINYEMRRRCRTVYDPKVIEALGVVHEFTVKEARRDL